MTIILGFIVVLGMVFGGYMLSGGEMGIIMHALPFEGTPKPQNPKPPKPRPIELITSNSHTSSSEGHVLRLSSCTTTILIIQISNIVRHSSRLVWIHTILLQIIHFDGDPVHKSCKPFRC